MLITEEEPGRLLQFMLSHFLNLQTCTLPFASESSKILWHDPVVVLQLPPLWFNWGRRETRSWVWIIWSTSLLPLTSTASSSKCQLQVTTFFIRIKLWFFVVFRCPFAWASLICLSQELAVWLCISHQQFLNSVHAMKFLDLDQARKQKTSGTFVNFIVYQSSNQKRKQVLPGAWKFLPASWSLSSLICILCHPDLEILPLTEYGSVSWLWSRTRIHLSVKNCRCTVNINVPQELQQILTNLVLVIATRQGVIFWTLRHSVWNWLDLTSSKFLFNHFSIYLYSFFYLWQIYTKRLEEVG